jgi:UDP-glucose 4-epimerase
VKKALITGGAGFIGSHLSQKLLASDFEVVILDDLSAGQKENIPAGAEFVEGDIRDTSAVKKAIEGCDCVFHLAARVELQKSIMDPADCLSVNITGTATVVRECLNKNLRLLFASSCAVYPLNPGKALTEEMAIPGNTPYALSKRAGEQLLEIYFHLTGLHACSLRCFNVYGPRQRTDSPYAGVVAKFMELAVKREPLTIYGKGDQKRDFIHVSDVVDCYLMAAQSNIHGIFNVGTGEALSISMLADEIAKISGSNRQIVHLLARAGDALLSQADMTRTHNDLGFFPRVSLQDGLRDLDRFIRSQGIGSS